MLGKTAVKQKDASTTLMQNLDVLHQVDGLDRVNLRNYFYQRVYQQMFRIMVVMAAVILLSIFVIYYVVTNPPQPQYFATTSSGKLIKLQPLSEPNLSRPALVQWVTEAIVESNSYDYANYRKQLQRASRYFTAKGYNSFTEALRASGTLDLVKERKLLVRATVSESPIITGEATFDGRYAWKVEVPVNLSAENNSERRSEAYYATVVVIRASTLEFQEGIAINQIILSKRSRNS